MGSTVTIASRFNGPPASGNGGYVCGVLAAFIDGTSVVRLKAPPPLEEPMEVRQEGDTYLLLQGERVIAEARPLEFELDVPHPPSSAEARTARDAIPLQDDHVFPTCFVCGPQRDEGDGLRIFSGPVAGRDMVAGPWVPDPSLDDGVGNVAPEFLWSALDCPGAFSFAAPEGKAVVLGELAVRLKDPVRIGEPCVVTGWYIENEGRKHITGTAIFGEDGRCAGLARGTWIEIPQPTS